MLTGKKVILSTRTPEGDHVDTEIIIGKVVIQDGKEYYAYRNAATGESGMALKSVYDTLFSVIHKEVKPLFYKGENSNRRVQLTEKLTVRGRNKFYKK